MKFLAILVIALGSFDLKAETPRITRLKNHTSSVIKPRQQRRDNNAELIHQMLESNKKLMALLERRVGVPVIWEQGAKILTGKVVRGTLLNSIVSTNLSSPILVLAHAGQGLPPKTKFSCAGVTQNKRVLTLCSKMVTQEKEIPIVAQVLNLDGTSGLLGEYDDGKEELIMGAVASDFAQGMLSAAQTKLASPFGAIREDSLKNQLM
ncbi:MAG: hypothetical protein HYV97_20065, partial [Bdellovibrio sp.]|nr:hypothetical protein [Bdellovibrio sp.]